MKEYEEKENLLKETTISLSGASDLDKYGEGQPEPRIDNKIDNLEVTVTPEANESENVSRETSNIAPEPQKNTKRINPTREKRYQRQKAEMQEALAAALYENDILRQQAAQAQQFTQIQREQTLKERIDRVTDLLKQAKEEGNIEQETQATNLLSQFNAELSNLKYNRPQAQYPQTATPQSQQPYYDYPVEQPYYEEAAPMPAALEDVMQEHDWMDQSSPNYNPRLVKEAALAEEALANRYSVERRGAEIGDYNFYKEVANMVEARFSNKTSAAPSRPTYPANVRSNGNAMNNSNQRYVSPVNRNYDSPNIQRVGDRIQVNLTQEQREFARKLPLVDKNRNPLSDAEKEIRYAKRMVEMHNSGRL